MEASLPARSSRTPRCHCYSAGIYIYNMLRFAALDRSALLLPIPEFVEQFDQRLILASCPANVTVSVFELKQGGAEFSPRRHRGVSKPHLRGATRGPRATAHQIPGRCEVVAGASAASGPWHGIRRHARAWKTSEKFARPGHVFPRDGVLPPPDLEARRRRAAGPSSPGYLARVHLGVRRQGRLPRRFQVC